MLATAAEIGASSALINAGITKTQIYKAEAYRRYGRRSIDKWIEQRLILPIQREKNSVFINVKELDAISTTHKLFKKYSACNN